MAADAEEHATATPGFDEVLLGRYSCRAFRPDEVSRPVLERMLALAQRTATWCNVQPWTTYVVSGGPLERVRAELQSGDDRGGADLDLQPPATYPGVFGDRRRTAGYGLYSHLGIERSDYQARHLQMERNYALFDAPHLIVVTAAETMGAYGLVDAGAYIANLMNAAFGLGLATIAQGSLAARAAMLRRMLAIPDGERIVAGISLGYADDADLVNQFRTKRAALREFVRWLE